jgi:HSP20 family protein
MANPKTDGNQPTQEPIGQPLPGARSQTVPVHTDQPEAQRGDLIRRDPLDRPARDPFQLIRDLLVEPFRALGAWPGRAMAWNPSFEIRETDDAFVFRGDIPGLRPDQLDISVIANQLQISGSREQDEQQDEGRYHTYERAYGSFTRVFTLPDSADIDHLRAELDNGVLTLSLPKKPGGSPQRRKIQVGSGAGAKS